MLIILFGLAGSGKNYLGELLATHYHFHFCDGDNLLPIDMQQRIQQKQPFTQPMRDHFTQLLIETISELKQHHKNIVIAQGLYKEKNRNQLAAAFPDARFIYITAPQEAIINRLKDRHNNVDETYANQIQTAFEEPSLPVFHIQNNSDRNELIKQLDHYFKTCS